MDTFIDAGMSWARKAINHLFSDHISLFTGHSNLFSDHLHCSSDKYAGWKAEEFSVMYNLKGISHNLNFSFLENIFSIFVLQLTMKRSQC